MSILILTAHTTLAYKIQCKIFAHSVMFNVFDLMSTKNLKFGDLILMFKSVVRGYAILTNQELPDIHLL
jgi:hydrogenase maturation factor